MKFAAFVLVTVALLGAGGTALVLHGGRQAEPSHPGPGLYRGSEPPGRIALPRFVLPRSDGEGVVRSDALRGRIVLTTFVDSACKQSCPIIVGILGDALRQLRRTSAAGSSRSRSASIQRSIRPHTSVASCANATPPSSPTSLRHKPG